MATQGTVKITIEGDLAHPFIQQFLGKSNSGVRVEATSSVPKQTNWLSPRRVVAFLVSGTVLKTLTTMENWTWAGEKLWDATAYAANAFWVNYLGALIGNTASHINRFMQDYGLLPTHKLPHTDLGSINLTYIRLPNWGNQEGFLSGFKSITQGLLSAFQTFTQGLSNSSAEVLYVTGSACITLYILYAGSKMGLNYVEKNILDAFGRPVLSKTYKMEDSANRIYQAIRFPFTYLYEKVYPKPNPKEKPTPIFSASLEEKMDEIVDSIQAISKANGTFFNVLFWGPSGTGKTMSAESIAEKAGVNFIEISGGDIIKFTGSDQHPVALIDQVFSRMEASDKPVILFIDELDAIGLDRSKLDPQRREILDALLNRTGTPSEKVILMGATNRPQDLDPAILNRFPDRLHLEPPQDSERLEMLEMYIHYFFKSPEDLRVFTPEVLNQLNDALKGQTGRSIYYLVNKWLLRRSRFPNQKLTKELIFQSTITFLEEENQIESALVNE